MTVASEFVPDTSGLRKARGAFFTPPVIARFVAEWAIAKHTDQVLEPSCGEAAFLTEAVSVLNSRRPPGAAEHMIRVDGVEIHPASAVEAGRLVAELGATADIGVGDFFMLTPESKYDAVIGNPPFVRYQDFAGEARARSRAAALRAGVPISGLASSWAAFTVHSALFLKTGGKLGLVIPAELLSVNYAADVRRFLMQNFTRVDLVMFTERVFPEVQEEVVLLLADGFRSGSTDHASIYQFQNADELHINTAATTWKPQDPADKWTPSLFSVEALAVYTELLNRGDFVPLQTWGETTLGMVTGNNKYFALSPARANELELPPSELLRLSPPGSKHLRGLTMTNAALNQLGRGGSATWLFRPSGDPSEAAMRYIEIGEKAGVNTAYKCRVRKDWWRVPLVKPADLFLTYMNADTPRITTNAAKAHHLNSIHGVYLHAEHKALGKTHLPMSTLTSMTLVGAEAVGRAYGGGMLKIEPREADRLPVPSPALIERNREELDEVRPQLGSILRRGQLKEAAKVVDEVLLVKGLGLKRSDVAHLRDDYARLASRRASRA